MAAQDPTSPDTAFSDASQVGTPKRDWKERLGGALAGSDDRKNSPLRQALDAHHQRRMDEAEMHKKNAATAAGALAYGIDPATGQPLTDEQKATFKNQYDAAMGHYEKIVGVDKNTKSALQRARTIIEHITKTGQGGGQGQQQGRPGGLTPPPQPQGAQSQGAQNGASSAGISPPPQPPGAEDQEASYKKFAAVAPFERRQIEQRQALQAYTDKEKALYELKIKEDAAKAKTKSAAHPTRPAPGQYSTSVLDARTTGQVYMGFDGNPIDLDKVPDTMGLKGALVYNPDTDGWDVRYTTFSPNQSSVTVGGETFAINPMDKSKLTQGQGQDLGAHNISTTTRTTDPATGQTTVSKHTPQISGVSGRPGSTSLTPPPTPQEAAPRKGSGSAAAPSSSKSSSSSKTPPLDDQGLIRSDWTGATPQVVEGANQLIQDRDVDKIPAKTRELSAALARKAGWFQGKWTPQDESRMNQTKTFLEDLRDSGTLKVLDSSAWNRYWVGKANEDRSKGSGVLGEPSADVENYIKTKAAKGLTDDEARFNTKFNQMVSVASGMATLTRAGRATNSMVESIRKEMPNVLNAKDSKDARNRINNLLRELDNAHKIGTTGQAPRRGGITLPPKPDQANGKLSDAAKKWLEANP